MRTESLEFFKTLVNTPSPSGYEEKAAEVYRQYTGCFADKVYTDVHGSVWAILNPDAEMKIMLAGHMDEIGFLIHYIDEQGLIYFSGIGGHDSAIPVGQRVWVWGSEKVPGIIGLKPIHLLEDEERKKKPELKDLWVDIGATTREEVEKVISIGDVITFQYEFEMLMGDRATARGFDDKMGSFIVAEAIRLLKEDGGLDPNVGVYAVATDNVVTLDINIRLLLCQALHLVIFLDVPHDPEAQDTVQICSDLKKYPQASIILAASSTRGAASCAS